MASPRVATSGHESGARRWCALIIVVATLDGLSHPWPRARRWGRRSGSKWGRGRIGVGADVTRVARLGYSGATLSVAPHAFVHIPNPMLLPQLYYIVNMLLPILIKSKQLRSSWAEHSKRASIHASTLSRFAPGLSPPARASTTARTACAISLSVLLKYARGATRQHKTARRSMRLRARTSRQHAACCPVDVGRDEGYECTSRVSAPPQGHEAWSQKARATAAWSVRLSRSQA